MSDVAVDDEELDIEVGAPPATAEVDDLVKLKKAEYDELMRGRDSAQSLGASFSALADQLKKQNIPVNAPEQRATETDEEYEQRIGQQLFQQGFTVKTLRETFAKESQPIIAELRAEIADLRAQVTKSDSRHQDVMAKYEPEVQELINRLPLNQRATRAAYDWAVGEVRNRHFDDILNERIEAELKKRQEKASEADSAGSLRSSAAGPHMESRGTAPTKKKVYVDSKEVQRLMSREHLTEDQAKAYLARKVAN